VAAQFRGGEDGEAAAFDLDEALLPEVGESAGEGFAGGAQFGGEEAFGGWEVDFGGVVQVRVGATIEEPIDEAGFDVLEGEVLELADEVVEVGAHGGEQAQAEFGLAAEQCQEAGSWDEDHL